MARIRIKCLSCFDKFVVASLNDVPADCPLCGAFINSKDMPEVAMPFIGLQGGARTKSIDQTYRDAERSSEARIDQAVAMTPGSSREDFASLKVTDFRAGMVEGESAVRPPEPSRAFKDNIAALQSGGVTAHGSGVVDLSGQVQQFSNSTRVGPAPNAGIQALDRLRESHRGNIDPRMSNPISSIPALETQSPTYVPRGKSIIPGVNR